MDFLGTKLATCSCDKNIRIFDLNVQTGTHTFVAELKGHEGPVWQVRRNYLKNLKYLHINDIFNLILNL